MIYYITDEEKLELKQQIMDNIYPDPNSGCWIWLRACGKNGYGCLQFRKKLELVHRLSYFVFIGMTRLFVCHKCDTPSCCNPQHLFAGTNTDNVRDAIGKGRFNNQGEAHVNSKLTEEQVLLIRDEEGSNRALGKKYKVSSSLIGYIKNKERWSHL